MWETPPFYYKLENVRPKFLKSLNFIKFIRLIKFLKFIKSLKSIKTLRFLKFIRIFKSEDGKIRIMITNVLEGTWEEITRHADELRGHKLRVTILDKGDVLQPNRKALEALRRIEERQKDMLETSGAGSLETLRRARSGEMFGYESDD